MECRQNWNKGFLKDFLTWKENCKRFRYVTILENRKDLIMEHGFWLIWQLNLTTEGIYIRYKKTFRAVRIVKHFNGRLWIPSGKVFNGGQILSYLEWIKNNLWKRGNEMKVVLRSLAVLKLQVKFSLPMGK